MKTAHVVYIANLENVPEGFSEAQAISDLGLEPGSTFFTASHEPFPPFEQTVQNILSETALEVFAIHATIAEDGRIQPFGEPMRFVKE